MRGGLVGGIIPRQSVPTYLIVPNAGQVGARPATSPALILTPVPIPITILITIAIGGGGVPIRRPAAETPATVAATSIVIRVVAILPPVGIKGTPLDPRPAAGAEIPLPDSVVLGKFQKK